MTGFIYAVRCGAMVKIGFSKDPRRRFHKIASDAPMKCEFLGAWPGTLDDEAEAHKMFGHLRSLGEWFRLDASLAEFISSTATMVEVTKRTPKGSHPLIEYARKNGISMDALAREAGTSRTTLYRIIEGEQNATVGLLQRIVEATNGKVSLASLLPKPAPKKEGEAA